MQQKHSIRSTLAASTRTNGNRCLCTLLAVETRTQMKAMINTLKNYIHEQKYMHICSGVRFGGILVAKEFVIKAMNS